MTLWDAPAISLDISHVAAGSAGSDLALAITMVCATAFLDAHRMQRALEAAAPAARSREDDPRQRRGMAGAADRGPRRVLPGRVQARPPDRRAALDGAAPPLRPRRRRRHRHPPAGARQGPLGRDGDRHRLPPAPRRGQRAPRAPSGSPAPRRSASPTTRRASRCGGSAGAPTRCATSAQSASARSPRPTPRWRSANR